MGFGSSSQSEDPQDAVGALFPVFIVSVLGTFLIPATIARVISTVKETRKVKRDETQRASKTTSSTSTTNDAQKNRTPLMTEISDVDSEWGKAAMARMKTKRMTVGRRLSGLFRGSNLWYTLGWIVMVLLMTWIVRTPLEEKGFNPYDILGVRVGATPKEIKSAYRKMSLKFHPDKNPDPSAAVFFAESIAPAYKTLTDDTARENYEKYGHPDGKQSTKLGVALPETLFGKGVMAPVMLISLVVFGILLPLVIAMVAIRRTNKYAGSNVLMQTRHNFAAKMKPVLALQRIPEMLALAHEFSIDEMPLLEGQAEEVSHLLKSLKTEYDSKDQKLMKRTDAIIKAHMLILAQTSRKMSSLPAKLTGDARKIGAMIPSFLDEIMKIGSMPFNRAGHTYARPQISVMEFFQCFTQAVPVSVRKASEKEASLMQLPHFDQVKVSKLTKAKSSAKDVLSLMDLPKADREKLLTQEGGFTPGMVQDIERHLLMIPRATTFETSFDCDGGSKILEGDFITCKVKVKITRTGGPLGGVSPPIPFCGAERKEGWRLFVADTSTNTILKYVTLDKATLTRIECGEGVEEITIQFPAPPAGGYLFGVALMSDYWIGVDAKASHHVKIAKRTEENLLARGGSKAELKEAACCDDDDAAHGSESESDGDGDDDDVHSDEDDGYPSDETGTSESDDDVPVSRRVTPLPKKETISAPRPKEDESKKVEEPKGEEANGITSLD